MVMWEFLKSLEGDVGKDVRLQFYDERGDYTFDGKIQSLSGDRKIMIFEHEPVEAERMNSKYSKLNLSAIIVRGVDYLTMPTAEKMKKIKKDAFAQIPCPKCKTPIFLVEHNVKKEE